jgi:hypothetical protein
MLFKAWVANYVAKGVLHWHAIGAHHAVCVDVDDVDMVEGVEKVCAGNDLAGFVEGNFGEDEL